MKKKEQRKTGYLLYERSGKRGLNPRPLAWEANALPTELFPQSNHAEFNYILKKLDFQYTLSSKKVEK